MRGIRFAAGLLLLLAVGTPTYFLLAAARSSREVSDTRALLVALHSLVSEYSVEYGDCPLPKDGGLTYSGITTCDDQGRILDAWDRPLVYRVDGAGPDRRFVLYSLGPDGRDESGRGDDVTSGVPQVSVGRAPTAAPPPPREIVIPPETGPMASLHAKLEFESKDWKTAINEVGLLVPTELTSDRYLTVLGSPARTTEELLYKAAYVRFSIPEREVVDGSGALLLAICNSKQHLIVRQAAWAALRGIHLEPDWRGFKATNHRINDSCPEPVLTDDSHQFAKVAAHALRNPESDDLRWMIQYLTVNEFDLPSGFVDLADDFAQFLATNAWSAQLIAHDLTRHRYLKKSRPHCDALIAALLDHEPKLAALFKR